MEPLVKIDNITKIYYSPKEETIAIKGFSLNIFPNDFVALVGPSGCGKSTVLSILAGLTEISEGSIAWKNESRSIGYMFQQDQLFPWLTIYKNAILGLSVKKQATKQNIEYVKHLLNKYGLGEFINSYPSQLSGGMRQRAALIRTLAVNPDILLLDEPFSALDYQTRLSVSDDIGDIINKEGITAVLVTHDLSEALCHANRVALMSERPSKIVKIYDIMLPETAQTSVEKRKTGNFIGYYEQIHGEMNKNV